MVVGGGTCPVAAVVIGDELSKMLEGSLLEEMLAAVDMEVVDTLVVLVVTLRIVNRGEVFPELPNTSQVSTRMARSFCLTHRQRCSLYAFEQEV